MSKVAFDISRHRRRPIVGCSLQSVSYRTCPSPSLWSVSCFQPPCSQETDVEDFSTPIGEQEMNWRVLALVICLCGPGISSAQEQLNVLPDSPRAQTGIIV